MSRFYRIVGIAVIVACALTFYGSLQQSGRGVATDPFTLLDILRPSLADSGLHQSGDVLIELNGREVALGFSRAGCDGLLLVSILPRTAQGWAHMAPRLDLTSFRIGYLYEGALYPAVPRFERLGRGLLGDLRPHEADPSPQVVAIAESGHCDLASSAAAALKAISRGRSPLAGRPDSPLDTGERSS
jgi:hypothetical protein